MDVELVTTRFHRKLIGLVGKRADGQCFGEVGSALMEKLWPTLKAMGVEHYGVVHWVYDSPQDVFVGVELKVEGMEAPEGVEYRYINYQSRLQYVHIGPYESLPEIWDKLVAETEARELTRLGPDMEVYEHHDEDPSQHRTTVMIGLLADE